MTLLAPLAERIRSSVDGEGGGAVERAIFGDVPPAAMAAEIEGVAGGPVAGCTFYGASVGCVAGLRLAGGADVVVKVHQERWSRAHLARAVSVQAACVDAGLPAPRPLVGPVACGNGLATVEAHLPDPGPSRPGPRLLPVSAAGLARLVAVAGRLELRPVDQPLDRAPGRLYPEPHSPLFDLAATQAGAGWIDDLAERALAAIAGDGRPPVVAHMDWSARNVRFGGGAVRAIYDGDSVAAASEAAAVGTAGQTWRALGRWDDHAPPAGEVLAYVDAYGEASGRPLDGDERRAAAATALHVLAYSARCERCVAGGRGGPATRRLRADGDLLLRSA